MSPTDCTQFTTERIDEGLNFSRNHRFFLLYGQHTSDEFLTRGMLRANLRETLWASLKQSGFGCVVLYNAADKLFFLDEESCRLSYPQEMAAATPASSATPGNGRMQRGPLGGRNVLRGGAPQFSAPALTTAQSLSSSPATSVSVAGSSGTPAQARHAAATSTTTPAPRSRFSAMNDQAALTGMNQLMLNATTRTAIVIEDLENLSRFDHQIKDILAACLKNWGALKADNQNAVVFISAREAKDEESERAMRQITSEFPEIANLVNIALGRREEVSEGFVLCVPPPFEAEIERLIDEQRLLRGLRLNWPERSKVTRWLAAENKSLKKLDGLIREFTNDPRRQETDEISIAMQTGHAGEGRAQSRRQETDEISIATVKRRGWISGDSDPRPALERLAGMAGMERLYEEIEAHIAVLQDAQERRALNQELSPEPLNLHLVLTGNPGTGKTTVAGLIGEIYRDLGLLKRGHTVTCRRAEIVQDHVGGTARQMNALINDALDGVLFIDEAHQLKQDERDVFGKEAIGTLLTRMENDRHRLAVIVAGYEKEMERFISSDQGLESRFGSDSFIHLDDYSPEVLYRIFERRIAAEGLTSNNEMREAMQQLLASMYERRLNDKFFGRDEQGNSKYANARTVRDLVKGIIKGRAVRLRRYPDGSREIAVEDIPESFQAFLAVAQQKRNSLEELMAELNALVGLQPVKEIVRKLVNEQRLALRLGRAPTGANKTRHMLFLGNSGTGKTTVARLIGQMFGALGLLKKGHFTEVTRVHLVEEHIGGSAKRTKEKIESALDGVLFIDEAYALVSDPRDSFGKEVISTLITYMEDYRDRLVVICAGYTKEMHDFLNANSGIASRVGYTVEFPDYTGEEMLQIFLGLADKDGYQVPDEVREELTRRFVWLHDHRDRNFGNGRDVRKFYGKMIDGFTERCLAASEPESFPKDFVLADLPNEGLPPGASPAAPGQRTPSFRASQIVAPQQQKAAFAGEPNVPELVKRAVGFVQTDSGSGTGFAISPQGHILTAYHVVEGARSIQFRFSDAGELVTAEFVDGDKQADLAVLRIAGENLPFAKLSAPDQRLSLGAPLGLLGYPMGQALGAEITYTSGALSSLRQRDGVSIVQIDMSAYHGNSGGPVFLTQTGEVVGVLSFGPNDTMNFAIAIEEFYRRFS